ncbi:MAG: hypothetical protein ACK481_02305 [Candidatus Melainabacteria bacterium]
MLSIVFIGIGVISLVLILLLKKQIDSFYDRVKGLSEEHKKYYKNVVVFLIPIFFVLAGIVFFISSIIDSKTQEKLTNLFTGSGLSVELIIGGIAILFGVTTFILRMSKNKYKYFAKLAVMEEKYGKNYGNIIHMFSYTIAPIGFGLCMLYQHFN